MSDDDDVVILSSSPVISLRRTPPRSVDSDSDIEILPEPSQPIKRPEVARPSGSGQESRIPGSSGATVASGSSSKTTVKEQRNMAPEPAPAPGAGSSQRAEPQAPIQTRQPEILQDPLTVALTRILEVVPNVQPAHATNLLNAALGQQEHPNIDHAVAQVAHALFESSDYPKIEMSSRAKGKRKAVDEVEREPKKVRIDFGSWERPHTGGPNYFLLALERLMIDFPYVPKPYIRQSLQARRSLYAPTYLALQETEKRDDLPYVRKLTPYRPKGKSAAVEVDASLQEEIAWIQERVHEETVRNDGVVAEKLNEEEYELNGDGIECGCCFSDYPFNKMIQCPDAHLFCMDCMTQYVSTQLGEHNPHIVCMSSTDPPCKLPFTFSELERFMTPKLLELYHRVKQRKDIEAAGIEGLEECPFCEYKVVIENPNERLFRCENVEICGVVSCRQCKKPDHLPKTCQEADNEKHLDGQHAVDEAMSQALMRNCPKCKKAFIKESGCNKMTCPSCGTLSCYTCRQVITGYEHYKDSGRPDAPGQKKGPRVCLLHDAVEKKAGVEVEAAAKKALQAYKEQNPDMDDDAIKIDTTGIPGTSAQAQQEEQQRQAQVQQNAALQRAMYREQMVANPIPGAFPPPGPNAYAPLLQYRPPRNGAQHHHHHYHHNYRDLAHRLHERLAQRDVRPNAFPAYPPPPPAAPARPAPPIPPFPMPPFPLLPHPYLGPLPVPRIDFGNNHLGYDDPVGNQRQHPPQG